MHYKIKVINNKHIPPTKLVNKVLAEEALGISVGMMMGPLEELSGTTTFVGTADSLIIVVVLPVSSIDFVAVADSSIDFVVVADSSIDFVVVKGLMEMVVMICVLVTTELISTKLVVVDGAWVVIVIVGTIGLIGSIQIPRGLSSTKAVN